MTNYDILKEYEAHQTPVPSYEEWQAKLEENTKLKFENDWYSELLSDAAKDVGQLKALLKECRELLSDRKMYGINTSKTWNILVLINQVLGEE